MIEFIPICLSDIPQKKQDFKLLYCVLGWVDDGTRTKRQLEIFCTRQKLILGHLTLIGKLMPFWVIHFIKANSSFVI
jgi:hypothetical protein